MTSENYRQILNNEFNNKGMSKEDFDNTLMHFANLYHKEQLSSLSDIKSFDLGKEAIIVECFKGHEFEDGELVEIVENFDNELWLAKSKSTGKEWYITEEEADIV